MVRPLDLFPTTMVTGFKTLEHSIGPIDAAEAARLIGAGSDLALVLDRKGVICDLFFGNDELSEENREYWLGRPWVDTVTVESRPKVEMLLREVDRVALARSRELNQRLFSGKDLPIRFSAVQLGGNGNVIALGRDLRIVSQLQQRLMDAQRAMERDYLRLRGAETRYRMLFHLSNEAILIIDGSSLKIIDLNPAAGSLLETTAGRLVGRTVGEVVTQSGHALLMNMIETTRAVGRVEAARVILSTGRDCYASSSLFRQDNAAHILIRLMPLSSKDAEFGIPVVKSQALQAMEQMPEAFVIVDNDRFVIEANHSFAELVDVPAREQLKGQPIDRWLGRSGVETNVLFANLKEHGSVRNFSTAFRGPYGSTEDVEVSGVHVAHGDMPCFGLILRVQRRRSEVPTGTVEPSRTASQLSELVGRVPLRELVRETTELTERLCIEASLTLTGDNRAAAAQMLGLSRQSLYSKLRRYNLGDLGPSEEDEAQD